MTDELAWAASQSLLPSKKLESGIFYTAVMLSAEVHPVFLFHGISPKGRSGSAAQELLFRATLQRTALCGKTGHRACAAVTLSGPRQRLQILDSWGQG